MCGARSSSQIPLTKTKGICTASSINSGANGRTTTNRVRGLLAAVGIKIAGKDLLPEQLDLLRQWNGEPVPEGLKRRLLHELERMELLARQIKALEIDQAEQIRDDQTRHVDKVRALMRLKGVGPTSATILVYEFFGWRQFGNRREVGCAGGADADALPERREQPRTGHQQGRQRPGSLDHGGAGVELVALPTQEPIESVVPRDGSAVAPPA